MAYKDKYQSSDSQVIYNFYCFFVICVFFVVVAVQ